MGEGGGGGGLHGVYNFYLPTFPENVSAHYVQVGVIRLLSGSGIIFLYIPILNRKTKHHP